MTPKLKAKWIGDLRANPHLQATKALRTHEGDGLWGFCPLGRLCEVAGIEYGLECKAYSAVNEEGERENFTTELPRFVLERLGLPVEAAEKLMKLNDNVGLTFPEIADWIEANL